MKDLINDEEEEVEEDSDEDVGKKKRRHGLFPDYRFSWQALLSVIWPCTGFCFVQGWTVSLFVLDDFDDNLEDEDYDLIEENLGVKVQRVSRSATLTWFSVFSRL